MNYRAFFAVALLGAAAAIPVRAQQNGAAIPPSRETTPVVAPVVSQPNRKPSPQFKSEVRLQGLMFGNFYQAATGSPAQNVYAIQTAYRGTYRPAKTITDFYGEASLIRFTNLDAANPYAGRLGLKHEGKVNSYEAFLDRAAHRPAFDVANHTGFATVTTLYGRYGRNLGSDWRVGGEALQERQRFDVRSNRANDYSRLTLLTRYRGLGEVFQPFIGYSFGKRDVNDHAESYREHYWSAGFSSMPNSRTYTSISYQNSHRLFDSAFATPGEFSRNDAHPQWSGFASYRLSPRWTAGMYYSHDLSRSPIRWRNYNTSFLSAGVTARF